MEQNTEPRNKSTHIWSTDLQQVLNGERIGSSTNDSGKTSNWYMQIVTCKRKKPDPYLTLYTKIN